ncbi:MAG: hypothetical protein RIG61_11970 [Deltaproteobacteria bacterium]
MTDKRLIDYRKDYWDSGQALIEMGESYTLCEMLKVLEGFLRKSPRTRCAGNDGRAGLAAGRSREREVLAHLTQALSASGKRC